MQDSTEACWNGIGGGDGGGEGGGDGGEAMAAVAEAEATVAAAMVAGAAEEATGEVAMAVGAMVEGGGGGGGGWRWEVETVAETVACQSGGAASNAIPLIRPVAAVDPVPQSRHALIERRP